MPDDPTFSIGESVGYENQLWQVEGASVMGVTGWRYTLVNKDRRVEAVWPHEMQRVNHA